MPTDFTKYPFNWTEISQWVRFTRAKGRCECVGECGLHRTHPGPRRCVERHGLPAKYAKGSIVLTTAHLCKCRPLCANEKHLKAMCQRCHLRVDLKCHISNAIKNASKAKHRKAGLISVITKGQEERTFAVLMAAWTRRHGKLDSKNPYSRENYAI